ncbi:hypothetical protein RRG08_049163 [Elysia crispata]|uniref:Uncharacterized protein n=1 Tax=Elysia crispata TaxID=231223 RepID=A0AAE1E2X1_9GAST|nr:hypothetical protein RRG08_049163 [Elysia crispata]
MLSSDMQVTSEAFRVQQDSKSRQKRFAYGKTASHVRSVSRTARQQVTSEAFRKRKAASHIRSVSQAQGSKSHQKRFASARQQVTSEA